MIGRREFTLVGLSAGALAAIGGNALVGSEKANRSHMRKAEYERCATACSDCQHDCDFCASHCAELLVDGHKNHLATLQACRDCADICSSAAQIVAREGAFAGIICEACTNACAHCAKLCEEQGHDDKIMQACAEECRRCEKACREMLSAISGEKKPR